MKKQTYAYALFITSLGVILMSVESLLIKMANISGITYAFYLGLLLFAALQLYIILDGFKKHYHVFKTQYKIIIFLAFLTAMANVFFIQAVKHTTVANVVIIIASSPLFATLFAYLLYRQKPHKNVYLASFFIFIGLFIIFFQELSHQNLLGDVLALLCTVSFSLTFVLLSRYRSVDIILVLWVTAFVLALMTLLFVSSFDVDTNSIFILLLSALFVTPLSRIFVLLGTKTLPASEVSLLTVLETVLAPIWAWMVLDEVPAVNAYIGGTIILLALALNSFYLLKQRRSLH